MALRTLRKEHRGAEVRPRNWEAGKVRRDCTSGLLMAKVKQVKVLLYRCH